MNEHIIPVYACPDCGQEEALQYRINYDVYICSNCQHGFTVLSTEKTHVNYTGGPPQRAEYEDWLSA